MRVHRREGQLGRDSGSLNLVGSSPTGRLIAIVGSLALLTAACGELPTSGPGTTSPNTISLTSTLEAAASPDSSKPEALTLGDFLGMNDSVQIRARAKTQHEQVEGLIKECMAAANLPYAAMPLEDPVDESSSSPDEYAALYGFGVVTGLMGLQPGQDIEAVVDPNQEYLSTLKPDERERWERTLLGELDSPGCAETANRAVFGRIEQAWDAVRPIIDEFKVEMRNDPAYQRATEEWSACVTKATGSEVAISDRGELHQWVDESIAAAAVEIASPGAESQSELNALLGREIEVAVDVRKCDSAFENSLQPLLERFEGAMLAENQAEFDQLLAVLEDPLGKS